MVLAEMGSNLLAWLLGTALSFMLAITGLRMLGNAGDGHMNKVAGGLIVTAAALFIAFLAGNVASRGQFGSEIFNLLN